MLVINPAILSVLLFAVTVSAAAQVSPVIVPQPTPPGAEAPVRLAPSRSLASGVLPPAEVAAVAIPRQADLSTVVLPAAPSPAACFPKPKAKKTSRKHSKVPDGLPVVASALNPFDGVVGIPVSDSQLNRFIFPEPVEGVYFPEGAPLPDCAKDAGAQDPCKPVFLNARHMILLQLRAGAKGPVQMLVHLLSGRLTTLNLLPAAGPGAVVRVDGAEDGASDARLALDHVPKARGMPEESQDVTLLATFARGEIPPGYESVPVGPTVRYDVFDVVPLAAWSNGSNLRAHLMQVSARGPGPVALNPGLFRRPGIKAVALDRDTVTEKVPALLYLLEQMPGEGAQ